MSIPAVPRSQAGSHPTRQQLDELEALIQHMLTLPVNNVEEEIDSAADAVPVSALSANRPEQTDPDSMIARAGQERVGLSQWEEDASARYTAEEEANGFHFRPSGLSEARLPSPQTEPLAEPASQLPAFLEANSGADRKLESAGSAEELEALSALELDRVAAIWRAKYSAHKKAFVCLQPLVWINVAFDVATGWLGPVGRWLQGPRGRTMLGLSGLGLLAAALVWGVLGWIGWTW